MKWAVIGLAVAGAALLITGWRISKSSNSDIASSSFMPMIAGLVLWAVDVALMMAWGAMRLLAG